MPASWPAAERSLRPRLPCPPPRPLQDVPGQTHSFIEHIRLGVAHAAADAHALLLFSGGRTRRGAGPRPEGEGYWLVAEAGGWYGHREVRRGAGQCLHRRDSAGMRRPALLLRRLSRWPACLPACLPAACAAAGAGAGVH